MWVIKLGGSIANTPFLKAWLETVVEIQNNNLVIVPGGGVFADHVRECQNKWRFDNRVAHKMALLAMHQFGLMLTSLQSGLQIVTSVNDIRQTLTSKRVAVWAPNVFELDQAGLASEWDITSDSLSAWLAGRIGATRLVIVKSSPQSSISGDPGFLAKNGVLDAAFLETWEKAGVDLKIVHCSRYSTLLTDFMEDSLSSRGAVSRAMEHSGN